MIMKDRLRIAIIGGGLGGLTAAILLERAGYEYKIFEQAPELTRIGAGIHLYQNSTRILGAIGVLDKLTASGLCPQSALNREWDTGRIYFAQLEQEWEQQFGAPHLMIHRGDLQEIMTAAIPEERIQFNKCLTGLDERNGVIKLSFRDGAITEADIVIGADGVNSAVREILLGPEPPTYTGVVAYRAIFPTRLLGEYRPSSDWARFMSDDRYPAREDRHFIFYYLTRARDEIYFVTGSPDPNWEGLLPVDVNTREIKKDYEGFHEEVQRVIDACPAASKWPLLEREPLPLWSRGRIVLLGDACHPMKPHMGQGAGMAIEDAAMLVRCIETAEGDYSGAFDLYMENRIDRTTRVQRESHNNRWMRYPTDPTWCFGYDAMTVPLMSPSERPKMSPALV